ncbi:MAG: electron transfer flavoprotein subunit beta/FixA family protein [Leptonema illini]|uniref:Electron transfer flavoprotein subunit beta n=1 Tax=Leptonema illini TaxID=183 RepID=A0A833GX30_9LEPT|nr:MAG: electron transfer flavoprotein subunit beta/FixA family protein [Leptonema illini]
MKLLVCIKQVPDMESKFRIDADGLWYDRADLAWRMNEYDEYAVEQAVQVKETTGGDLTVLCIGPEQVKETMKKALAMGCDRGIHIADEASHQRDPFAIASLIAAWAKDKEFDLIFTGMQSQDRGSGQVGVMAAELLGLPALTTVIGFALADGTITVRRELEGGVKAKIACSLPALVTCQLGLNTPRYPTLPNIMKAKKKELLSVAAGELNATGNLLRTVKMAFPEKRGGGVFLEGEVGDVADRLIRILKEKTSVLA